MKAGVDMFRAWRMWDAYQQRGVTGLDVGESLTVMQWLTVFIETMAQLPPRRVEAYMGDPVTGQARAVVTTRRGRVPRTTALTRLRDAAANIRHVDTVPWDAPTDWQEIWKQVGDLMVAVHEWSYVCTNRVSIS